jgi:predicted transcriptional regulator
MTTQQLNHLFDTQPLTVAGVAKKSGIPIKTLRDIVNGRRSSIRGIKPEVEEPLREALEDVVRGIREVLCDGHI